MRVKEKEAKHFKWCADNGIKIYPIVDGATGYRIVIEKTGKQRYSKNPKKNEPKWYEEIQKLYTHYYRMGTDKQYRENFRNKKSNK